MRLIIQKIFDQFFAPEKQTQETNRDNMVLTDAWCVRWFSRWGEFSTETRQECEIFATEEEAHEFANRIKEAFQLIRHTSNAKVTVEQTIVNRSVPKMEEMRVELSVNHHLENEKQLAI